MERERIILAVRHEWYDDLAKAGLWETDSPLTAALVDLYLASTSKACDAWHDNDFACDDCEAPCDFRPGEVSKRTATISAIIREKGLSE